MIFRVPIKLLELFQPKSGKWFPMKLATDGSWVFDTNFPNEKPVQFPINLRLTSVNGKVITDKIQSLSKSGRVIFFLL